MGRSFLAAVAGGLLLLVSGTMLGLGDDRETPLATEEGPTPSARGAAAIQPGGPDEPVETWESCGEHSDLPSIAERRVIETFRLQLAPGPALPGATKDVTLGGNASMFRIESTFFQGRPGTYNPTGAYVLQLPTVRVLLENGTEAFRHEMRPFLFPGTSYMKASSHQTFCPALGSTTTIRFDTLGWGDVYADVVIETIRQAGGAQ